LPAIIRTITKTNPHPPPHPPHVPRLLNRLPHEHYRSGNGADFAAAYRRMAHIPPTLLERDFNFPPFAKLEAEVARVAGIQAAAMQPAAAMKTEYAHAA